MFMVIDSPLKTLYTIDYKIVKIFIIMNINENISRIKEIMGLVNEADSSVTTTTTQYNPIPAPVKDNTTNIVRQTSGQLMEACKKRYSQSELNKAIAWWNNWLNNSVTKQKFSKNHNISLQETNEIFEDYKDLLKDTKLVYKFTS